MNGLELLLGKPIFQALGWTLIHFIWEGVVVAMLYASVSVLLRRSTANVRYAAACIAMVLMLIAPVATIFTVSRTQVSSLAVAPAATESAQKTSVIGSSQDDRRAIGSVTSE